MSTDAILEASCAKRRCVCCWTSRGASIRRENPKALEHRRGERSPWRADQRRRWYATFDADEKETHRDEMTVCAELAKMFG